MEAKSKRCSQYKLLTVTQFALFMILTPFVTNMSPLWHQAVNVAPLVGALVTAILYMDRCVKKSKSLDVER
ncbi:MAG: hypothetical protein JSW61_02680 [Candidatus Thorarchaeota archaeon]|nr:MAG: hypothetical protein JSW61_02680 [Candidatus Thorarchaeota archaeon]